MATAGLRVVGARPGQDTKVALFDLPHPELVALGADSYLAFAERKSAVLVHLSSDDASAGAAVIATGSSLGTTLVQQGSGLVAGLFDSDRIRIEAARLTP